jgi:hypothetical protein
MILRLLVESEQFTVWEKSDRMVSEWDAFVSPDRG